jgi:hypothetical protein
MSSPVVRSLLFNTMLSLTYIGDDNVVCIKYCAKIKFKVYILGIKRVSVPESRVQSVSIFYDEIYYRVCRQGLRNATSILL